MASGSTRENVLDRLARAMDTPLTHPGSQSLALAVIEQFQDSLADLMAMFADKMLATLADGDRHDALAVSKDRTVGLWFVVWPGSHREVQVERIGEYFGQLAGKVKFLLDAGVPLQAFLEFDAYIEDGSSGPDVKVEYSFLPAELLGGPEPSNPSWSTVLLNSDLLSVTERQAVANLMA